MKPAPIISKILFAIIINLLLVNVSFCQGPGTVRPNPSPFALPVPALQQTFAPTIDYRGLVVERYQSNQRMIGTYKVSGNSYLFNGPVKANIYSVDAGTGYDVMTAYDTYTQKLEIFQGAIDVNKVMIKSVKEIDSFLLKNDKDSSQAAGMFFINSRIVDDKKSMFLQRMYEGKNFTLYKSYKAVLDDASTDYLRSDEKVFSIKTEYYYSGISITGIKKIKPTKNGLKNEFPERQDIKSIVESDNLDTNTEETLVNLFKQLNEKK